MMGLLPASTLMRAVAEQNGNVPSRLASPALGCQSLAGLRPHGLPPRLLPLEKYPDIAQHGFKHGSGELARKRVLLAWMIGDEQAGQLGAQLVIRTMPERECGLAPNLAVGPQRA